MSIPADRSIYSNEEIRVLTTFEPLRFPEEDMSPLAFKSGILDDWEDYSKGGLGIAQSPAKLPRGKAAKGKEKEKGRADTFTRHRPRQGTVTKATMDILRWSPIQLFGSNMPPHKLPPPDPPMSPTKLDRPARGRLNRFEPASSYVGQSVHSTWRPGTVQHQAHSPPSRSTHITTPNSWRSRPRSESPAPGPILSASCAAAESRTARRLSTLNHSLAPLPSHLSSTPPLSPPDMHQNSQSRPQSSNSIARLMACGTLGVPQGSPAVAAANLHAVRATTPLSTTSEFSPTFDLDTFSPVTYDVTQYTDEGDDESLATPPEYNALDMHQEQMDNEKNAAEVRMQQEALAAWQELYNTLGEAEEAERASLWVTALTGSYDIVCDCALWEEQGYRATLEGREAQQRQKYGVEWVQALEEAARWEIGSEEYADRRQVLALFVQWLAAFEAWTQQSHAIMCTEDEARKAVEWEQQVTWELLLSLLQVELHETEAREGLAQDEAEVAYQLQACMEESREIAAALTSTMEAQVVEYAALVDEEMQFWCHLLELDALVHKEDDWRCAVIELEGQGREHVGHLHAQALAWLYGLMALAQEEEVASADLMEEVKQQWGHLLSVHMVVIEEDSLRTSIEEDTMHSLQMAKAQLDFELMCLKQRVELEEEEETDRQPVQESEQHYWLHLVEQHEMGVMENEHRRANWEEQENAWTDLMSQEACDAEAVAQRDEIRLVEQECRETGVQVELFERLHLLQQIDIVHHCALGIWDIAALEATNRTTLLQMHRKGRADIEAFEKACQTIICIEEAKRSNLLALAMQELKRELLQSKFEYNMLLMNRDHGTAYATILEEEADEWKQLMAREVTQKSHWFRLGEMEREDRAAIHRSQAATFSFITAPLERELQYFQGREQLLHKESNLFQKIMDLASASKALILIKPQYIFSFQGIPANIITPKVTPVQYEWALRGLQQKEMEERLALMLHEEQARHDLYLTLERKGKAMAVVKIQSTWRMYRARRKYKVMRAKAEAQGKTEPTAADQCGAQGYWFPGPVMPNLSASSRMHSPQSFSSTPVVNQPFPFGPYTGAPERFMEMFPFHFFPADARFSQFPGSPWPGQQPSTPASSVPDQQPPATPTPPSPPPPLPPAPEEVPVMPTQQKAPEEDVVPFPQELLRQYHRMPSSASHTSVVPLPVDLDHANANEVDWEVHPWNVPAVPASSGLPVLHPHTGQSRPRIPVR